MEIITHLLLARHQKIGRRREIDVTLKSSWMRRATRLLFNRDAVIDNFPVDVRSNSTPSFVQIIFPHLSWLWQVVFVNPLALWHSRFTPAPCLTGWPSPNDSTHDQSLTSRFYDSKNDTPFNALYYMRSSATINYSRRKHNRLYEVTGRWEKGLQKYNWSVHTIQKLALSAFISCVQLNMKPDYLRSRSAHVVKPFKRQNTKFVDCYM